MLVDHHAAELGGALDALDAILSVRREQTRQLSRDRHAVPLPSLSTYAGTGPLAGLIEAVQLDEVEALVVVAALAAEVDESFVRRIGELSARPGPPRLTGEALRNLVAETLPARIDAAEALAADGRLRALRILELDPSEDGPLAGGLRLVPDVARTLLGMPSERPVFSAEFPATPLETVYEFDDLVLSGPVRDRMTQVEDRIRYRQVVVDDWGFGADHDNVTGLTVLFHGPSGTGKTMAAALLAKSAEIAAYKIDLANLVSKYIGETTKNLERIFARAERERCLLFFDEADAVFGKRGEVTDARDRYANQEVSYLLQRIETFPGTVILASNLLANIDEAFVRRIDLIVEFPPPGRRERTRLWNRVFPSGTPLADSFDFEGLARDFELTGAQILAAAIDAAYRASANGMVVDRDHLELAIRGQFDKSGLMPPRPT